MLYKDLNPNDKFKIASEINVGNTYQVVEVHASNMTLRKAKNLTLPGWDSYLWGGTEVIKLDD